MKTIKRFLRFLGWTALFVLFLAAAGVITGLLIYTDYEERAAQYDLSKIGDVSQRSAVYDMNGELYSYLHGENRLVVPLDKVSGWFVQALLAREDSRFWEHRGVDYFGIARAIVTNLRTGDVKQGASTITQQLARNSLDLGGKNYDRKALEAVLAQRMERTLSKSQILEMYVNRIYFGSGFYGIETASRGYFGKSASELNLSESAILAGLIRSPNRFSPRNDLNASLAERDTVLERMIELYMISPADAEAAKATKPIVNHDQPLRYQEDYAMDAVNRELHELLDPDTIAFGGLKIYTTVDPSLQKIAREAADRQLTKIEEGKKYPHPKKADFQPSEDPETEKPTDYLQAALVAVDNRNGAIRAIVGGRDYEQSKYPRALLAKRQIGSTFKPFVYAAAFQRGLMPASLVSDDKIDPNELRTVSNNWSPANSDGEYMGHQPAAVGLIKSRNTMTVRVGEYAGMPSVYQMANDVGIGESMLKLPVSYLGAFETNLKELAGAYTAFPNLGVYRKPHLIARIDDPDGNILYQAPVAEKRVMSSETAWITSAILQQVMKSGTAATSAKLGWKKPSAGKTGTTNDFFDAWFVGYTSSITCGVWVGMDKPQTIMHKGYGSTLALPIWVDFMKQLPERMYPAGDFNTPFKITKVSLCSASGARATSQCEHAGSTYEMTLPEQRVPGRTCHLHPEPAPTYVYDRSTGTITPSAPINSQTPVAVAPPSPSHSSTYAIGAGSSSASSRRGIEEPTTSIDQNPRTVTNRSRMDRTARGIRVYPDPDVDVDDSESRRPQETVRVLRAIPVTREDRERIAREQRAVRVYRAEPLERGRSSSRRIIRVVPVE